MKVSILYPILTMETLYLRTPVGDAEIQERQHGLTRWQRATLIVIGGGKRLDDLRHDLRQMPETLESILDALIAKGLVKPPSGHDRSRNATGMAQMASDPLKEMRRHLTYLIGIIENTNASAALGLTIRLKKAASLEEIRALQPVFMDHLRGICGTEEAHRLLEKLALEQA